MSLGPARWGCSQDEVRGHQPPPAPSCCETSPYTGLGWGGLLDFAVAQPKVFLNHHRKCSCHSWDQTGKLPYNIKGGLSWISGKSSSLEGDQALEQATQCSGHGTKLQSSRSVWTKLSDIWSNFGVILCVARGGTQLSLWFSFNLRYSVISRFYDSKSMMVWHEIRPLWTAPFSATTEVSCGWLEKAAFHIILTDLRIICAHMLENLRFRMRKDKSILLHLNCIFLVVKAVAEYCRLLANSIIISTCAQFSHLSLLILRTSATHFSRSPSSKSSRIWPSIRFHESIIWFG